jgi:multiple sugar transport system ATP-binding protein
MNLVRAHLATQAGGGLALHFNGGTGAQVKLDLPPELVSGALAARAGQEVVAGLRPEAVSLVTPGMVAGPKQRFVEARIEVIEPTGADTLVVVDLGGHEFTVRLEPDLPLAPGEQARFLVDLSKLVCFDAKTGMLIA